MTGVRTPCNDSLMNSSQVTEVRFTATRACRWDNVMHRWITISQETAQTLVAMGAVDLTDKRWI